MSPHLLAAAQWRRRLLHRELSRLLPPAQQELRVLLDCCTQMLGSIVAFDIDPCGVVVLRFDRREIRSLLVQMQATADAVQRAHTAGLEWTRIERITQRAWPLACELFDAVGWNEAFCSQPRASYAGTAMLDALRPAASNEPRQGASCE